VLVTVMDSKALVYEGMAVKSRNCGWCVSTDILGNLGNVEV
jgi:hypothetical protein